MNGVLKSEAISIAAASPIKLFRCVRKFILGKRAENETLYSVGTHHTQF